MDILRRDIKLQPPKSPASVMLKIWRFPVEFPTYRSGGKWKVGFTKQLLWSMKLKLNPSPNIGRMTAWRWHLFPCKGEILLMEEIPHQLRLVVYPLIYKVLCNPRWFFGISEPSTVRLQRQYESSEPKKPVPQKKQPSSSTPLWGPSQWYLSNMSDPKKKMWDPNLDLVPGPQGLVLGIHDPKYGSTSWWWTQDQSIFQSLKIWMLGGLPKNPSPEQKKQLFWGLRFPSRLDPHCPLTS